jgi:hypothetical protein
VISLIPTAFIVQDAYVYRQRSAGLVYRYYLCVSGYLKDADGRPVVGRVVELRYEGRVYRAYTRSDGYFSFRIYVRGYSVTALLSFAGDSTYAPSQAEIHYSR